MSTFTIIFQRDGKESTFENDYRDYRDSQLDIFPFTQENYEQALRKYAELQVKEHDHLILLIDGYDENDAPADITNIFSQYKTDLTLFTKEVQREIERQQEEARKAAALAAVELAISIAKQQHAIDEALYEELKRKLGK